MSPFLVALSIGVLIGVVVGVVVGAVLGIAMMRVPDVMMREHQRGRSTTKDGAA